MVSEPPMATDPIPASTTLISSSQIEQQPSFISILPSSVSTISTQPIISTESSQPLPLPSHYHPSLPLPYSILPSPYLPLQQHSAYLGYHLPPHSHQPQQPSLPSPTHPLFPANSAVNFSSPIPQPSHPTQTTLPSTSHLPSLPTTPHYMLSIKLTETNFLFWKIQVESYLRGQGLYGFLNGSLPPPPTHFPVHLPYPNIDLLPPVLPQVPHNPTTLPPPSVLSHKTPTLSTLQIQIFSIGIALISPFDPPLSSL